MLLKPPEEMHSDTHTLIKIQGISIARDVTVTQVAAMTRTGGYDHTRAHTNTKAVIQTARRSIRMIRDRAMTFPWVFAHRSLVLSHVTTGRMRLFISFGLKSRSRLWGQWAAQLRTKWRSQGQLWLIRALFHPHMDQNAYSWAGITRALFINIRASLAAG